MLVFKLNPEFEPMFNGSNLVDRLVMFPASAEFCLNLYPSFGLKYIAEDTGCKSGYLFAIKTIDDRFIGTLGLDYTKRKTKLDMESINHLQVHATSLGGVLMTHLLQ